MLALAALGWVLSDDNHAERLLTLTGLSPDALREGVGNRDILVAVMDFLMSHEPDLIAAADALGVDPQMLVAAAHGLSGPHDFDPEWSE